MTVKRFSDKELSERLSAHLGEKVTLVPIGNHDLKRHQVYQFSWQGNTYVFKYYYTYNHWNREISSMKILEEQDLPLPKIIDYGRFTDQREWLITSFMPGIVMEDILDGLSQEEQENIFFQVGKSLKTIHQNTFPHFGPLGPEGNFQEEESFKEAFRRLFERSRQLLLAANDHQELIKMGLQKLDLLLEEMHTPARAYLCHNDFDGRNLMLHPKSPHGLMAIIDFEHAMPWCRESDFASLYLKHFLHHPSLQTSFEAGYGEAIAPSMVLELFKLQYLLTAISWSKELAPDFYHFGLSGLRSLLYL